jgi:hypothetical protein
LQTEVAKEFMAQARAKSLTSDEHFTVDGTLLEASASVKSFQRTEGDHLLPTDDPGNLTVNFHGERRSNQTHGSKTDPDAKSARKGVGKEAQLNVTSGLTTTMSQMIQRSSSPSPLLFSQGLRC